MWVRTDAMFCPEIPAHQWSVPAAPLTTLQPWPPSSEATLHSPAMILVVLSEGVDEEGMMRWQPPVQAHGGDDGQGGGGDRAGAQQRDTADRGQDQCIDEIEITSAYCVHVFDL
eukprot:GFUD01107823.1.p1 GENE.GFUD01107823.1~~GFUD01107823.1.p1  ORF type:complete len:114 (+),score=35.77 GFUD01107823.1:785-1126(+)